MPGQQFNVPLGEHYALALKQLTARDDVSVPEILRPVVEAFLDEELLKDKDLATAVNALLRSRSRVRRSVSGTVSRRKIGPGAPTV